MPCSSPKHAQLQLRGSSSRPGCKVGQKHLIQGVLGSGEKAKKRPMAIKRKKKMDMQQNKLLL